MSAARTVAGVVLLALAIALAIATQARAGFGPARLVSAIPPEQANFATEPALSADGRYVAFVGRIDEGREGVFRLDLASGDLARVATGAAGESVPGKSKALRPSISADGRFVSLLTGMRLDPANDTAANDVDVYVADMGGSLPTYELASVAQGSTLSMGGESALAPRVALSGDGRRVAFVNDGQVYLRDLDAETTTLVSSRRDPESGAMEPGVPVPGGAAPAALSLASGAALSADGTTVAWLGRHLPAQVPLLADEEEAILAADAGLLAYREPLWRRVADGPLAPTRRVVGGGDPLAPGCPGTAGTSAIPACRGPFATLLDGNTDYHSATGWLKRAGVAGVPRLSADGRLVATIGDPTEAANAFLVDMSPSLSRLQAVRQLTAQVRVNPEEEFLYVGTSEYPQYIPLNAHLIDLSISADGRRLAFVTPRQRFPLAPPYLGSSPPAQLGVAELYLIDLETDSLQRLSHGTGGFSEPSLSGATVESPFTEGARAPTLDADGDRIGFSSNAVNLVAGDGNGDSDVFVVDDESLPLAAGVVGISAPPGEIKTSLRRTLVLSARSLPNGRVKLIAIAPAAGKLRVGVNGKPRPGARSRRLGKARAGARAGRPVAMVLALPRGLRGRAHSKGGLHAKARVVFRGREGQRRIGRIQVRFRVHPRKQASRVHERRQWARR